jgi:hypothetical protein
VPPVPGQQSQTHMALEVALIVAEAPFSVVVLCQVSPPSMNPVLAVAASSTVPGTTLTVSSALLDGEAPLTVKLHQLRKFFTVSSPLPPPAPPLPGDPPLPAYPPGLPVPVEPQPNSTQSRMRTADVTANLRMQCKVVTARSQSTGPGFRTRA